jgi:hypothetical protein
VRRHAINEYKSVLDLLVKPGCPVCTFLKNEQASLLQKGSDSSGMLCNAHTWGFAAVSDARIAAPALLRFLEHGINYVGENPEECWVCARLQLVESAALSDLSSSANQSALITWLEDSGALCAPHSSKVKRHLDPQTANLINESDLRKRSDLITALKALMSQDESRASEQLGTLGRAAEYLVAQRGLPR